MADIDLERKRGGAGWLWGILAVVAIALIVWWVWPSEEETAFTADQEPTAEVQPLPEPAPEMVGEQPTISLSQIIESPATYTGQTISPEVRVTEVPTDRGFWITDQGERLFVIIIDQPQEQPYDVQPNTSLRLDQAVVRDPTFLANLPGEPLDQDTRNIAQNQDVFLTVDEANIHPVGANAGAGTAGTGGM